MPSLPEPVSISEPESDQIRALREMMAGGQAALVGPANERREIPDKVYELFLRVLEHLGRKQAVSVVPCREELTTQTAADLLGVSRQYLVRLLEADEIPFHMVGTHRRVYLADLLAYRTERDLQRRKVITQLARDAVDAGIYDVVPEQDDE